MRLPKGHLCLASAGHFVCDALEGDLANRRGKRLTLSERLLCDLFESRLGSKTQCVHDVAGHFRVVQCVEMQVVDAAIQQLCAKLRADRRGKQFGPAIPFGHLEGLRQMRGDRRATGLREPLDA